VVGLVGVSGVSLIPRMMREQAIVAARSEL
jgi:hypothetical protein